MSEPTPVDARDAETKAVAETVKMLLWSSSERDALDDFIQNEAEIIAEDVIDALDTYRADNGIVPPYMTSVPAVKAIGGDGTPIEGIGFAVYRFLPEKPEVKR